MIEAIQHLEALKTIVDNLEIEIKSLLDRISQLHNDEQNTRDMRDSILADFDRFKTETAAEREELEEVMETLRSEKQRLDVEVSSLIAQKGDLQMHNVRIHQENDKIQQYNAQSWKILNTKEEELIARESLIEQRESLRPGTKRLLPPTE